MNIKDKLLIQLQKIAKKIVNSTEDVRPDVHIQDLGFDSKALVEYTEAISGLLAEPIHPGVFFEYTTLALFADYLLEHQGKEVEMWLSDTAKEQQTVNCAADPWQILAAELETQNRDSNGTEMHENTTDKPCLVIIGGGVASLLISYQLSKARLDHIIVGKAEIGDTPKLGESMTEVVSIEFGREFKHLSQYFYKKEVTPFFMGDLVAGLRFRFFESLSSLFLEENVPKEFIHIDRIGFDRALYEEVVASSHCRWIEAFVEDVEYSKDEDKVQSLRLTNKEQLQPDYVWDCTNHIRLLGKKLAIPYKELDAPRQVIFTHYFEKNGEHFCDREDLPWMHATSLLSADEEFDQLSGVSWLIPLGNYVSVGISMLPEDIRGRTTEEIIALLTKAYERRGLRYTQYFTRRKEVISVPSNHFMYDRFCGENWALVGGSGSSTWFTSGSNMSIAAFMASIAPKIVKEPQMYGKHYTRHVKGFAKTQKIYDTFMESNVGSVDALKFLSGIIEQARGRISSYYLKDEDLQLTSAEVAKSLFNEELLVDKQYLDFLRQIATHSQPKERADQTEAIFKKFAEMKSQQGPVRLPYLRNHGIRDSKPELFL